MFTIPVRIRTAASISGLLLLLGLAACRPASPQALATPAHATFPVTSSPTAPAPTLTPLPPTPTAFRVTPTAASTPACMEVRGQMVHASIEVSAWTDPLPTRIYLPPCYEKETRRYPVLYLLHGQTYTADQWDRLGVDEAADALIASGELPPFLIVFPTDPDWRQPDEDPFGEALVDEIVPWVDAHYRTRPERESRAIGGLSRGAGWAVHLGLTRWDLFSAVGAHSLALFWLDAARIPGWLDDIPPDSLPRVYVDIGRSDRELQNAQEFEAVLNDHRVPHEWRLFDGYHEEAYWSAHVEQYLRFYAEGW